MTRLFEGEAKSYLVKCDFISISFVREKKNIHRIRYGAYENEERKIEKKECLTVTIFFLLICLSQSISQKMVGLLVHTIK